MQIVTNVYPHDWPYLLNFTRGPVQGSARSAGG